MKRLVLLFLAALMTVPALGAQQRSYSMDILVDGMPLRELHARGTTYVEALEGREYSVRLRNHTPTRIAVALSIDGLNTIDAKTSTAQDASKWILGPYESITLDGWQTSGDSARRFFFTTEEKSYGNWLGKTSNLGIVSAAFFREKHPRPLPYTRSSEQGRRDLPAAPGADKLRANAGERIEAEGLSSAPDDDYAATGIGSEIDHRVQRVRFEAQDHPAAVLGIRYEYRDELVRLGVLPRGDRLAQRERSHGFEDMEFAPDPWGAD